jgi:hypothetical protein
MKRKTWLLLSPLLLILTGLFFFLRAAAKEDTPDRGEGGVLTERAIGELEEIQIKNRYDEFSVWQEEGGFILADLPMDQVNAEYLFMLLDESSRIEYRALVSEDEAESAIYGFADPEATVTIRYAGASPLSLVFGDEEQVSRGRYFMAAGADAVYLMDRSRAVRFLQPLKNFIDFQIVPARAYPSPLQAIKTLRLSGEAFPRPVLISEVRSDDEEDMRLASSFGAATHLVRSPVLHEIDQKECIAVFSSLTGLLNIEVFDYNVSDEELAAYGFDRPYAMAEYDYKRSEEEAPLRIVLRAVRYEGGCLLTRDDQRVIHRIERKAFINTSYEKLVMRWFLTPFITDLAAIKLDLGQGSPAGRTRLIRLSGEDNASLTVTLDGAPLDIDLFRKFYRLLISASSDGFPERAAGEGTPLLGVTFVYRDSLKPDDTMIFRQGSLRRLSVQVNGVTEFAVLERYLGVTAAALEALSEGRDFSTDW